VSYGNCTQAYADGVANIPRTSPSYAKHLDRDGDGVGCDKPPAGFVPRLATAPHAPRTTSATTTHQHVQAAPRLPVTGPGEVGVAGVLLLAAGATAVGLVRRRRTRFTAG
jgi:hypothetical protein